MKEEIKCIWANEDFDIRICKLECMPVALQKCEKCTERIDSNAK